MSQQRIWSERQHVCHKKTKSQSPVYIDKIYNSCERARGEQSLKSEYQKPHGQIKLRKRDSVISDDSEILCQRTDSQLPQQMEKWLW